MKVFEYSCVVLGLISSNCFFASLSQNVNTDNSSSSNISDDPPKVLVNPDNNAVNFAKPSLIRPTTAQVEFKPGVPPDWTTYPSYPTISTRPTRPSRPSKPTKKPRPSRFTRTTPPTYFTRAAEALTAYNVPVDSDNSLYSNLSSPEIAEVTISSNTIVIRENNTSTYPPGVSPPEPIIVDKEPDRGVFEWILGLVGIKPIGGNDEGPSSPTPCQCVCGLTYKHNRIVGGVETMVNEYPWMIYLMHNNRFFCGASLINNKYLLTAGHCVNGFTKEKLLAVFLDHDRSTSSETKTFFKRISKVIKHSAYGIGGSYNNDIALLQLEGEVPLTGILKPVCLPPVGKSFTGHTGIVTGWGATQAHGQVSHKLLEVKVPILSNIDCRNTGYGNRITDNMLCAGYPQGTKDSCQGDSGGPLHVVNNSYHMVAGIVSWGEGCAEPNYPGVYTRVNRYISWIMSNTKDACYCQM